MKALLTSLVLLVSYQSFSQFDSAFVAPLVTNVYKAPKGHTLDRFDTAAVMDVQTYRPLRVFVLSFPDYQKDMFSALDEANALLAQSDSIRLKYSQERMLMSQVIIRKNAFIDQQKTSFQKLLKEAQPSKWQKIKRGASYLIVGVAVGALL